jgi:hypothetical protein
VGAVAGALLVEGEFKFCNHGDELLVSDSRMGLTALSLDYFSWLLFLARGRESENPNDTKGDTRSRYAH